MLNSVRRMASVLVAAACLAATVPVAGCAGDTARKQVLLPTIRGAWANIQRILDAGPSAAPPEAVSRLSAAITTGDRQQLALAVATDWPPVKTVCEQNIDAMPVSPGVKQSEMERIVQFDFALRKMVER